jgi:hypothetical protein
VLRRAQRRGQDDERTVALGRALAGRLGAPEGTGAPSRTLWRSRTAYDAFVKQINCVCGAVVKGEDDDELWEKAQAHLHTDHPDLVGNVSREDILAQAEET